MGDCYDANGRYFLDNYRDDSSAKIVHGEVRGQGPLKNITFGHCWIEDGNVVIDKSNGRNIKMNKDVYYAIGNIKELNNMYKYDLKTFRKKILKYEHWGPWDLKTRY